MTQNALRVGVVGCGYFAQFHLDAWHRLPDADLVAVSDVDHERMVKAAAAFGAQEFADPEELLENARIDLLDIASPPNTHLPLISAAAARNIDVVCQKPFCAGSADAVRAVAIAEDRRIMLAVHENFRFQPWHREIAALLKAGALGDRVYNVSFRLRPGDGAGPEAYLARQPYFQKMPRFLVHETGVHFIDVFRFLFGEPDAVFADLRRLNPAIEGEDAGVIILRFGDGPQALFDGNRLVDHAAENRRLTMGDMLVEGSGAVVHLDGDGVLRLRRAGENIAKVIDYEWSNTGFAGDSVYRLQEHVVRHLRGGGQLENSGRDYMKNLEIVDAVYRAAEIGRWIALDPDAG